MTRESGGAGSRDAGNVGIRTRRKIDDRCPAKIRRTGVQCTEGPSIRWSPRGMVGAEADQWMEQEGRDHGHRPISR